MAHLFDAMTRIWRGSVSNLSAIALLIVHLFDAMAKLSLLRTRIWRGSVSNLSALALLNQDLARMVGD